MTFNLNDCHEMKEQTAKGTIKSNVKNNGLTSRVCYVQRATSAVCQAATATTLGSGCPSPRQQVKERQVCCWPNPARSESWLGGQWQYLTEIKLEVNDSASFNLFGAQPLDNSGRIWRVCNI